MVVVAILLATLAAESAQREQYRIRDLRWVRAREHAVQHVDLDTQHLRVVVEPTSVARLRCPQGVEPRRYLLGSALWVEGSFSKAVANNRVGDHTVWYFAEHPLEDGEWAFSGDGCDIDVRLERWRGRGLDRLARATDQPGSYMLEHQLLRPAEESWLRRDPTDPRRHEVLRPLATMADSKSLRPAPPAQEVSWVARDGDEDVGFVSETPSWEIQGPARIDLVARPLGDQSSVCVVVDEARSCRSSRLQHALPWSPNRGFETATIAGRPAGRARVWHAAVGSGLHTVRINTPAWVRLLVRDAPSAKERVRPLLFPDDCDRSICVAQPSSVLVAPAPTGPPAQTATLWRPGASPSGYQWESLPEAKQRPPSAWLDEQRTLHLRVEAPAASCELQFPTGQAFVAPPATERGRFVFVGEEDPALPTSRGCPVRVRVAPESVSTAGLVRSVFQILRPGVTLPYLIETEAEAVLRVSLAEREAASRITVESNLGTEVFTLTPTATSLLWSDGRGRTWTAVVRVPLGRLRWARVKASSTVAIQLHHRPALPAPSAMELSPLGDPQSPDRTAGDEIAPKPSPHAPASRHLASQQALITWSKAIAVATDPGERSGAYCDRAAALEAAGAPDLAAVDRRLAAALGGPPCTEETETTLRPQNFEPGGWSALDGRWLPKEEANPQALLAAARGDFLTLATLHAAQTRQPEAGSAAASVQLERWRRGILGGQILTPNQGVKAYVDWVRLTSPEMRESLDYHSLKRASRWQPVQGFSGECASVLVSVEEEEEEEENSLAKTLYPEPWPQEETVTLARRALLLPPAHHNQAQVWARCRATSPRMLHTPITLSILDAHRRPVDQVPLPPFGEAVPISLPSGSTVYLAISPTSGAACQARLPSSTVAGLRGRDRRRGTHIRAGHRAHVEVLAPTVLRLTATGPVLPEAVEVEVDALSGNGTRPGRVHGHDGGLEIPVTGVGPRRVWIQPTVELRFAAAIRVPRDSPLEPRADRLLLATLAEGQEKAAAEPPGVEHFFGGREESTRAATIIAYVHAGSDDILEDDDIPTAVRFREGLGVTHRLESLPLWWDAQLQLRQHQDSVQVTVGRAGLDGWLLRTPLDLRLAIDTDVAFANQDKSARLRGYVHVGTPSLRSWVALLRVRGMVQSWWPDVLFEASADDPALWSRYRDDHRQSLGLDPEVRWNASRWHRMTAAALLRTNDSLDDAAIDHAGLRVTSDHAGPGWQARVAAGLERRFADNDRLQAYWSPEVSGRLMYTWWPAGQLGLQVRAQLAYRAHFQQVVAGLMVRAFFSDDHALRDVRPSQIVHRAAAEWSQDASMEQDWPR